jgi:hypothetical protein
MEATVTQLLPYNSVCSSTLFLPVPDTNLKELLSDVLKMSDKHPKILASIRKDQDALGIKKKELRQKDKAYFESKNEDLPEILDQVEQTEASALQLQVGRPRMDAELVFVFLVLRGYFKSLSSTESIERLRDSITILDYLQSRGLVLPGITTIIENVNTLSNETRRQIHQAQLAGILSEGLDDFDELIIDSTSVEGNVEWPTDAGILLKLTERLFNFGRTLSKYGIPPLRVWWLITWISTLHTLLFKINSIAGKANSKKKLKKYYRKFLKTAYKSLNYLKKELSVMKEGAAQLDIKPSHREMLDAFFEQIDSDLEDGYHVLFYSENRVMNEVNLPAVEKVLAISDEDAAYIKKGPRPAKIGYKPQIGRSGNGFIPVCEVPRGNAADSKEFIPTLNSSIENTKVVPSLVSVDDGYSSKANFSEAQEIGVGLVSMSGSKGKRITPQSDWNSPVYLDARRDRSAVESLMFVLKYVFGLKRFRRRGLEEVRAELLEKVIAYNFCRMSYIRKLRQKEFEAKLCQAS